MSPEDRDNLLEQIVQQDATLLERLNKTPMPINEYADKVARFVDMWREEQITDAELVAVIQDLTSKVIVIDGNYVVPFTPRRP